MLLNYTYSKAWTSHACHTANYNSQQGMDLSRVLQPDEELREGTSSLLGEGSMGMDDSITPPPISKGSSLGKNRSYAYSVRISSLSAVTMFLCCLYLHSQVSCLQSVPNPSDPLVKPGVIPDQ